jgi:long-chain acyl-CoA synthetase
VRENGENVMVERIWLKNYAEGVPAEADVNAYPSINHLFQAAVHRYRALPAFTNMGTTLTYGEVERLSRDFAGYLQKDLGMVKGDRLAIMLPNVLQYPVVLFGAFLAGLTVVNVNPLYTAHELQYQLLDSRTRSIVVLEKENFAHTVQEVLDKCDLQTVITTKLGDLLAPPISYITNFVLKYIEHMVPDWAMPNAIAFTDIMRKNCSRDLRDVDLHPEDMAFLQYTGGTTGDPKGAMLSHGNIVANVRQTNVWCGTLLRDAEEIILTPLPLYHMFALTVNLLSFFNFGVHNILITNPRDMRGFIRELKKSKFTVITGVNTLYNAMLNEAALMDVDMSHVKCAVAGGAAVQRAVAERWKAATGIPIIEGYGLTEASAVLTCNPLNSKEWRSNVGVPYPSTEISILNDAGKELPLGEIGEVCARGPQIMKGYWNRPDETAKAFTADGWLRTGDMGFMDEDGWVRLVDRKNDMILVSGFNVYPNEVEDAVAMHPGVLESAAVGVPDAKSGEVVKLFVVKKDPGLTVEALIAHCRENLAAYKCPKYIEFRTELPKTPIGKVLRRALRDSEVGKPALSTGT